MTYETINAAKAVELLEQVVKGKENFVYALDSCVYIDDGECSCLVGHALVAHGVGHDFFDQLFDGNNELSINYASVSHLADAGFLPFVTPRAQIVFEVAQNVQDDAKPWGEALERAKRALGNTAYSDELS